MSAKIERAPASIYALNANGKTGLTIAARTDETHTSASLLPAGTAAAAISGAEVNAPHLPL